MGGSENLINLKKDQKIPHSNLSSLFCENPILIQWQTKLCNNVCLPIVKANLSSSEQLQKTE